MNQERLLKVIKSVRVTEKTTVLSEKNNEYTFKVSKCASKHEIKAAVEKLLGARVLNVRVVNVKPKVKLFKGTKGTRKGWKKAYVSLLPNEKLEMASV